MSTQTLDRGAQTGTHDSGNEPTTRDAVTDFASSSSRTTEPGRPTELAAVPRRSWGDDEADEEFDYIPVTPWAPISLVLGLVGLTGFIGVFGLYVAAFGVFVGIAAIARIRSSAGTVKGMKMAATGLVLAVTSSTLGSAKMYHAYQTEVPEGYLRVNFPRDICEKQFIYVNGNRKLDPQVAELMGKKIYIKGFMWATQDADGLANFILLKDNGECCFGGRPKSHDFVWVKLKGFNKGESQPELSKRSDCMTVSELPEDMKKKLGVTTDYQLTTRSFLGKVAVAGVMQADVKAGMKGPAEDFEFAPVYTMEAELVEEAWTRF